MDTEHKKIQSFIRPINLTGLTGIPVFFGHKSSSMYLSSVSSVLSISHISGVDNLGSVLAIAEEIDSSDDSSDESSVKSSVKSKKKTVAVQTENPVQKSVGIQCDLEDGDWVVLTGKN